MGVNAYLHTSEWSTSIDAREPDDRFWAQVELDAKLLREFSSSAGAHEANRRIEAARRHPAFADACQFPGPCRSLEWHVAHDVALLRAIELAHAGDSAEALALVRDLVRMDAAQLASARSLISLLIALDNLGNALDKVDMIVARLDAASVDAPLRATLAELELELRAVDVDAIDLRAVVVNDYLFLVEILDVLDGEGNEANVMPNLSGRPRWLYSRGLTLRSVSERFDRRYEAAAERDAFAALGGGEAPAKQSIGWWFLNPVGKQVLDDVAFDPTSLVSSIDEGRGEVERTRARLLARSLMSAT